MIMFNQIKKIAPLLDQLLVSGCNFLLTILLVRVLEPSNFGLFSMLWLVVISILSFVQAMFFSPMFSILPKLIQSQQMDLINLIYTELVLLIVAFFIISMLIISSASFFEFQGDLLVVKLFLLLTSSYYLYEFLRRGLMILGRNILLLLLDAITYLLILVGVYLYSNNSVEIVSIVMFVCFGSSSIVILLITKYKFISLFRDKARYEELFYKQIGFSKWLVASSGLQFLNGNVFTLLVGALIGLSQVGYIRMTQNIVGIINPIYVFLDNHAQLYLTRVLCENGIGATKRVYLKLSLVCGVGLMSMLSVIFILSEEIITFAYGRQPEIIHDYMLLMLSLSFFTGLNFLQRLMLKVIENTKLIFKSYFYASLFSCLFVYPLMLMFEGIGAVLAMIVAQVFMFCVVLSFKMRKITMKKEESVV